MAERLEEPPEGVLAGIKEDPWKTALSTGLPGAF
jgi:hypothetical protein